MGPENSKFGACAFVFIPFAVGVRIIQSGVQLTFVQSGYSKMGMG
jgi:hypothetical protein